MRWDEVRKGIDAKRSQQNECAHLRPVPRTGAMWNPHYNVRPAPESAAPVITAIHAFMAWSRKYRDEFCKTTET